jgi:hypothetical protein
MDWAHTHSPQNNTPAPPTEPQPTQTPGDDAEHETVSQPDNLNVTPVNTVGAKVAVLEYKVNTLSRLVEQMIEILESLTSQITSDKIQQWKRDLGQ